MKLLQKLSCMKSRAHAAIMAFALATLVPAAAFAANDWVTAIEPKITLLVADVTAIGAVLVLVVIAMITAKVVFGLLKKA